MKIDQLIGFSGRSGSGKTSAANHLQQKHRFYRFSFADPIKEGLRMMFGLAYQDFVDKQKQVTIDWIGKSPRELMQTLGTAWGRDLVNKDLWILALYRRMEAAYERHPIGKPFCVVIDDVRFGNEAFSILQKNGLVVQINRDVDPINEHISENGLNRIWICQEIENNGSIQEFYEKVDQIAYELPQQKAAASNS